MVVRLCCDECGSLIHDFLNLLSSVESFLSREVINECYDTVLELLNDQLRRATACAVAGTIRLVIVYFRPFASPSVVSACESERSRLP